MALGLTISPETRHKILTHLCERNQSAELVYQPEQGQAVHVKVRFLQLLDSGLVIDQPLKLGRPVLLHPGDAVAMVFQWGDQRLRFGSQVLDRTQCVPHGGPRVDAIRISTPEYIDKAQRRSCYRLSLVHFERADIRFFRIDGSGEAFVARMLNISETGCGVIAPLEAVCDVLEGELYITRFSLPDHPGTMELLAEIRWKRKCQDHHRIEMGVQWQLDDANSDARRIQRRLALFIAGEQRLALQRQRELRGDR